MELFGYFSSVLIGVSLGLIGGGGSILTVPVLVYLFSIDAISATVYSLFVVGFTSAIGSIDYFRKRLVNIRVALLFGLPSIAMVLLTRSVIIPLVPQNIFVIGHYIITKSMFTMLLFAVLMIIASYNMIKSRQQISDKHPPAPYWKVLFHGLLTGLVTGLVGAGGGFLIIPALVILLKLPMKKAVGTSLVIIAVNSLIGFVASYNHVDINWHLLLTTVFASVIGILIGVSLSRKIEGAKLKPVFGWFVLVMGLFVLMKETFFR